MSGDCFLQAVVRTPIEMATINLDAPAIIIVLRRIARVIVVNWIIAVTGRNMRSRHRRSALLLFARRVAPSRTISVNLDVVLGTAESIWADYPAREMAA